MKTGVDRILFDGWHARLARELAKREKRIDFQAWIPAPIVKERVVERDGVVYRAFPAIQGVPPSYSGMLREIREISRHEKLGLHLHDYRSPTTLFFLASTPPGVPIFLQDHGFLNDVTFRTPVEALLFRRPKKIDVISRYAKSYLTSLGINPSRIRIKTMGVDFDLFTRVDQEAARRTLGLPPEIPLVLYVGQFIDWKGLPAIAEAVRRMKEKQKIGLVAVGGTMHDPLYDYVKSNCEGVFVRVPIERMPLFYSAADVTCQLYLRQENGLGVNLMESLACGTPVVSNTLIHYPDQVEIGRVGKLVRSEDDLVPALSEVLREEFDPGYLRSASSKYFSWDTVARETIRGYEEALGLGRSAGRT